MTQEEKKLLEVELAARSQYGVICAVKPVTPFHELEFGGQHKIKNIYIRDDDTTAFSFGDRSHSVENIKPYLRPMSSMTEEEEKEFKNSCKIIGFYKDGEFACTPDGYDWLNEHHFDYRGLIPIGLALEAPERMYK